MAIQHQKIEENNIDDVGTANDDDDDDVQICYDFSIMIIDRQLKQYFKI